MDQRVRMVGRHPRMMSKLAIVLYLLNQCFSSIPMGNESWIGHRWFHSVLFSRSHSSLRKMWEFWQIFLIHSTIACFLKKSWHGLCQINLQIHKTCCWNIGILTTQMEKVGAMTCMTVCFFTIWSKLLSENPCFSSEQIVPLEWSISGRS